MSEIVQKTLEQVCPPDTKSIISGPFGSSISSRFFVDEGIPVIRGNNLFLTLEKYNDSGYVFVTEEKADELKCDAFVDDLIFTAAGTLGQVGIIPHNAKYPRYVISNKQIRARLDCNIIDPEYAYFWFSSPWIKTLLQNSNKGSTVPLLTLSEIKSLPIFFPEDIAEQKAISGALNSLSEKITNNTSVCTNMEKVVKLIYDYWFVQFDFPDQNGKPYKTNGGAMEWNAELKREIPRGWKVKKLSDLACEGKDCPYTSSQCVPTFDLSVMPSNNMLLADFNESKNFSTNLFVLKQGDILFGSIRPYLRKAGIAPCDGAVAGTVHVIRPRRKEDYNFLATTLCSERMFKYATTVSQGTKMPVVTIDSLFDYKIAYDETVAEKFNGFDIKGIFSRIAIENHELAALRDFLLPMLMNGQVKLKAESSESGASPTQSKSFKTKITEK